MKKLLEKIGLVLAVPFGFLLEHGWILLVAGIILWIVASFFDIPIIREILVILLYAMLVIMLGGIIVLTLIGIFYGVKFLINKYKEKYDESVKAGENRVGAFLKYTFKGVGVFLLILLALVFVYYIEYLR